MKTLFPSMTAFLVITFVSSVGYAENQLVISLKSTADSKTVTPDEQQTNVESNESAEGSDAAQEDDHSDRAAGKQKPTKEGPTQLSAAPLTHVTYPEDRPAWVANQPNLDAPVHTWVVTTGGCDSNEMCSEQLEALIPAAVALYIKTTTGWECDDELLDSNWIEEHLVAKRYVGTLTQGDQILNEAAVELEFDEEVRNRIRRVRENAVVGERLCAAGGVFALGLIGLFCTGGVLGFCSRRFS